MTNKKNYRNFAVSTMAATAVVAAAAPAVSAAEYTGYPDVPTTSDHYDAIKALSEQGVIQGYPNGDFGIYDAVTRGQVAAMLTKALDLEIPENVADVVKVYTDVDADDRYADQIAAVTEAGIFSGSNDAFNAADNMTRQQMATVLVLGFDLDKYDTGVNVDADLDNVNASHADRVQTLLNLGVSSQVNDFRPIEDISRGAFSTMLHLSQEVVVAQEVERVSAINEAGVEVTVKAVDEDRFDQTIEVTDNNGNKVDVKPATIAADQDTVYFEFVKEAKDQEGVWNIAGIDYDFDLASNLQAFENASTQLGLNKAFNDLGIKNVDTNNIAKYSSEKSGFLLGLKDDLTTEAIQDWVDEINASLIDGEASAAIAKKVTDAIEKKNDIALKNALGDSAFQRVNNDWITDVTDRDSYKDKIAAEIPDADADDVMYVKDIQKVINKVNTDNLAEEIGDLNKIVDKKKLNEAKSLLNDYATPGEDGKVSVTTQELLDKIEVQLAVADVAEAPTPNTLKRALTALDELLDKNAKFMDKDGDEGFKVENLKYYLNGYKDVEDGIKGNDDVVDADSVKLVITEVNKAVDADATAINNRLEVIKPTVRNTINHGYVGYSVNVKPFKDTNADPSLKVEKITVELYKDKTLLAKNESKSGAVTYVNDNEKASAPFDVFDDFDYVNDWEYSGWNGNALDIPNKVTVTVKYDDGKTAIQTLDGDDFDLIEGTAKDAKENITLKLVNNAETASDVNDALLGKPETSFLNIPKADRLFVAEAVLDARNDKEFEDYGALETALGNVVGDDGSYTEALAGINKLEPVASIDTVREALQAVSKDFKGMSNAEQANIAEDFFNDLEFDGDVLKTKFKSLSAVKTAAGI